MAEIVVLPHHDICPEGAVVEAAPGETVCEALLRHDIDIEHACEMSCACTTCHVIIREGFDSLAEADELEEDFLDKAWGLEPESRLSCQASVGAVNLVVEIPRYTINHASERH
jgi:2Fe-2S ferredoxin